MRHSSLLVTLLLVESELCSAFPWSRDGVVHWLSDRGTINNVIAHTEEPVLPPIFNTATSISKAPRTSKTATLNGVPLSVSSQAIAIAHSEFAVPTTTRTPHAKGPDVSHQESSVPDVVGPIATETAQEEQPAETKTSAQKPSRPEATTTAAYNTPHGEATVVPLTHTEAPAPTETSQGSGSPSQTSSSSGDSSSSSGSGYGRQHEGSETNNKGSAASSPADQESSSGYGSPDIGAPGWQSASSSNASPVTATAAAGAFALGSSTVSYSAMAGAQGVSAVLVGSQTATPGQTLTINSQEVVVSATGSSLYFAPIVTVMPQPAPSSVTRVWTEGGKVVTGVFAAPSGHKSQPDESAAIPTTTAIANKPKATVASAEAQSTTAAASMPSSSSSGSSASDTAPTGAASRATSGFLSLAGTIAAALLYLL